MLLSCSVLGPACYCRRWAPIWRNIYIDYAVIVLKSIASLEGFSVVGQARIEYDLPEVPATLSIQPIRFAVTQCDHTPQMLTLDEHMQPCRQRSTVTFAAAEELGTAIGFDGSGAGARRVQWPAQGTPSPLSKRQAEILYLLAKGDRLSAIAARLQIADSTVNLHLAQMKKKLKAKTKEQALAMALVNGWVTVESAGPA